MNLLKAFIPILCLFISCIKNNEIPTVTVAAVHSDILSFEVDEIMNFLNSNPTNLELQMKQKGLINIHDLDSSIVINIKYSTTDNLTGIDMYGWFNKCYLLPDVAANLVKAQKYLAEEDSSLSLMVFDCARPLSAQFTIWNSVKSTNKNAYVAYPTGGSLHNFGAAVDVGIFSKKEGILNMGTPFDLMEPVAQPRYESKFLREGKLRQEHIKNRQLLRSVMKKAGFINIQSEWWHFNAMPIETARAKYQIIK